MYIVILTLYLLLLLQCTNSISVQVTCPHLCSCFYLNKLRSIECKGNQLVNIPENVNKKVEVFSLSYNVLNVLADYEFMKLELLNIRILELDHNHINEVGRRAFNNLVELHTLDMSWNRVRYIHKDTFADNQQLFSLNLAGNPFGNADLQIQSNSLTELNLTSCGLPYLNKQMFDHLPNLQMLYLEGNTLIEVPTTLIDKIPHLHVIRLTGNSMNCNEQVLDLERYLTEKNIEFKPICKYVKFTNEDEEKPIMMEKMILAADNIEDYENIETMDDDVQVEDEKQEQQQPDTSNVVKQQTHVIQESRLDRVIALIISGSIGFQIGTVFGICIGYFCLAKYNKRIDNVDTSARMLRRHQRRRLFRSNHVSSAIRNQFGLPPGTPPPPYRQRDYDTD